MQGEPKGKVYLTRDGAYQGRSICFESLNGITHNVIAGGWRVI